ncbi:DinB family protein [soil metagenome]
MKQDEQLREQLIKGMQSGRAFTSLDQILAGISLQNAGRQVPELPYTLWQLMEHLRIALWDILEFSRDPDYASPQWPEGYWPDEKAPTDQKALDQSRKAIADGIAEMGQLVKEEANDLFTPFPHGSGQNLVREVMLVAEHNAYHLGQIVLLRRLLGDWEG